VASWQRRERAAVTGRGIYFGGSTPLAALFLVSLRAWSHAQQLSLDRLYKES